MKLEASFKLTWNDSGITKIIGHAIDGATEKVAKKVEHTAKKLAPVKTGKLRGSIKVLPSIVEENGYIINTDIFYASYVELGTSRIAPTPFLRHALEYHAMELEIVTSRQLRKLL